MPRPTNTAERRRQIADGLRRAMGRDGYDGASIAEIARAASLAPGIVHYHFDDKREILVELLATLGAEHDARLDDALAEAGDEPSARLRGFLDANLAVGRHADPLTVQCWVAACAEAIKVPAVRAAWDGALAGSARRLDAIIRRGVAAGAFRPRIPVDAAVAALLALIQGYLVLAVTARSRIPRRTAAGAALVMAEGLLHPVRPLARKPPRRRRQ